MLKSPIFIGGSGRSGTTVLQRFFNSHPHIFSLTWETQFIVSKGGLIELLQQNYSQRALKPFLQNLRGRWFRRVLNQGKPNEYTAGLCSDVTAEELEAAIAFLESQLNASPPLQSPYDPARSFVQALFSLPTLRAKADRWCEKTPRNILYADHLWRMFPHLRFIHIIRDGRDVVASMLKRKFWPIAATEGFPATLDFHGEVTFEKAVNYWIEMLRLGRMVAARIPSDNYLEIKLEDLVESRHTVEQLFDFLEEPLLPHLFDYDLSKAHKGRWKEELTSEQIRFFHEQAGDVLGKEGYEV